MCAVCATPTGLSVDRDVLAARAHARAHQLSPPLEDPTELHKGERTEDVEKNVLIRGRVRHLDEAAQSVRVGFRPDLHRYGIIVATHHRDRCRYHHRPKRIPNSLHPTRVGEIPERLLKKAQRHRFVLGLDPLVLRYPSHVANNPVRWALPDIDVRSNSP